MRGSAARTFIYLEISPGDYIVRQGEIGFEIFFIAKGVAEAVDFNGKVYARMTEGSFFGEIALFTLAPRSLSVISRSRMELYSLHKVRSSFGVSFIDSVVETLDCAQDAFARVQNYFPDEAQKFVSVAEGSCRAAPFGRRVVYAHQSHVRRRLPLPLRRADPSGTRNEAVVARLGSRVCRSIRH